MDPAALGTAIIGLETIRVEQARNDGPTPRHAQRRQSVRNLLAAALRRTANVLDPVRPAVADGRATS